MSPDLDVAVVGAGAAGLATAFALQRAGRSVQVFESADHVGGRMATLRHDGFVIDTGAEMIATHGYPATWRLIHELGLSDEDVPRVAQPISIWRKGRVHPDVGRPRGLATGAGLSARGRMALIRFQGSIMAKARSFHPDFPEDTPLGDVTVEQLAGRYPRELTDYMFQPIAGGFFGWQLDRSAAAAMVCLLIATKDTSNWRTYRDGMDTLARKLAERVDVLTATPVREVVSGNGSPRLVTSQGELTARSVVVCVPAPQAADLCRDCPEVERRFLEACTYAPMLRVSLELERPMTFLDQASAYVVLIPAAENAVLSVMAIDQNKEQGRSPESSGLVSLLTAPTATRELLDSSDDRIVLRVLEEGERYLPGLSQATKSSFVHRFPLGLPEATPEALRLRTDFMRRPARSVDFAGDWVMARPSSEGAIRSADIAAWRVMAHAGDG